MAVRKTHECFVNEIKELYGEEFTVLGRYEKANIKIEFKHNLCGTSFKKTPNSILRTGGCKFCADKKNRRTPLEFEQLVAKVGNNEYKIIKGYSTSRVPVRLLHEECGFEFDINPNHFINYNRRCPVCSNTVSRTNESFIYEVRFKTKGEYLVVGEYDKNDKPMTFRHTLCGSEFDAKPVELLRGRAVCANCNTHDPFKSQEDFEKEVEIEGGGEYEYIDEYKGCNNHIKIIHKTCGNVYLSRPSKFLEGFNRCEECKVYNVDFIKYIETEANSEYSLLSKYKGFGNAVDIEHKKCGYKYSVLPTNFMHNKSRCPMCAGVIVTHESYKKSLQEWSGGECTLLSDYVNSKTKVKIRHEKCGNEYWTLPNSLRRGVRCNNCMQSRGEHSISKILTEWGINFRREFSTNLCMHKGKLRFDFAIFDEQNILIGMIEYDGRQHFEPVEHFGGYENYKAVLERDALKDRFCRLNDIPLIRIPYWEEDVQRSVDEGLVKMKNYKIFK